MTSRRYTFLHSVRIRNWEVYAIGDSIAVDAVLRYETLAESFAEVWRQLGIEGKSKLPWVNVGPRRNRRGYRDYYDDRTRRIIADWYADEIRAFGYEF